MKKKPQPINQYPTYTKDDCMKEIANLETMLISEERGTIRQFILDKIEYKKELLLILKPTT